MAQDLQQLIEQLASSGTTSPELLQRIQAAMNDESKLDEVLSVLKEMGADQMGAVPRSTSRNTIVRAPSLISCVGNWE